MATKGSLKRARRAARLLEQRLAEGTRVHFRRAGDTFEFEVGMASPVRWSRFVVPKAGLLEAQCEDYARVIQARKQGLIAHVRAAVSDGATEGVYSGLLARHLVTACLKSDPPDAFEWLAAALESFNADLAAKDLPWHALAKLERGTFATLAMLDFRVKEKLIDVLVIGDSCVAVADTDGNVVDFVPLAHPEDFNADPWLLSNLAAHNQLVLAEHVFRRTYKAEPGMTLFCMTDALSRWFLEQHRSGELPARVLDAIIDRQTFADFVNSQRNQNLMKNDDVALTTARMPKA